MSERRPLLLVVEDEPQMLRFLRPSLAAEFKVLEVGTAGEALRAARTQAPELILLDLGLPDGDGVDLARRVRKWSKVPIIVISARRRDEDKVEALDAGADDYLTKPFGITELLARIRVAFRHAEARQVKDSPVLEFGPLRVDTSRRAVEVDARQIHLTPIEYKLLVFLAQNAGKVLTHRQILEHVWGPSHAHLTHHLVVRMADLRKKIEPNPRRPALLITEPGVGYKLRDQAPPTAS